MSSVLYYSNLCENCKNLLAVLSRSPKKKDVHFLCIDKRIQKANGAIYIILENNQEMILPPTVTKVPALLLLNDGHKVLYGEEIKDHLSPQEVNYNRGAVNIAKIDKEPEAFAMGGGALCGVESDQYSFLDQSSDSLSAKGDGGMRQLHNYATINQEDIIETPPDTYEPDKIGNISVENLQMERNGDVSL
jgi:hypothetical protein